MLLLHLNVQLIGCLGISPSLSSIWNGTTSPILQTSNGCQSLLPSFGLNHIFCIAPFDSIFSRFFVIVIVYCDSSLPIVVEQNGTNNSHHSPVTTAAGITTAHDSHQFMQKLHRATPPTNFPPWISSHCAMLHPSLTSHLFTKHHTQLVKHPTSNAAQKKLMIVIT